MEVEHDGEVVTAGPLNDPILTDNVRAAEAVLTSLVEAGYFVPERAATFEFLYHFDSIDAWLAYRAENWVDAEIDAAVVERARAMLVSGGEFRIRQGLRATRLRRG